MESQSRRDLLRKSAAAAGVAGVVWSAPRVEGLSLRPDYAAAQSGAESRWSITADRSAGGFFGSSAANAPAPADTISLNVDSSAASSMKGRVTAANRTLGINCQSVNVDRVSVAGTTNAFLLSRVNFGGGLRLNSSSMSGSVNFSGGAGIDRVRVQGRITCD